MVLIEKSVLDSFWVRMWSYSFREKTFLTQAIRIEYPEHEGREVGQTDEVLVDVIGGSESEESRDERYAPALDVERVC